MAEIGDTIRINDMYSEPQYTGIDSIGQLHGS